MSGPEVRLDYQQALRVIGRRLDAEPTYNFSLHERDSGFSVQFYPSRFRTDHREIDFTWERLQDLFVYHLAGRGVSRRHHRYRGIWSNFPNGHEDFFRALGFDMDREHAVQIDVEEGADEVSVRFRTELDGEQTTRSMGKGEIQSMLEAAQSRRQQAS